MAAETLVLENILGMLDAINKGLLTSMKELEDLRNAVNKVKTPLAALEMEEGDSIHGMLGKLVGLLYQADDLLDEILTRYCSARYSRNAEVLDADQGANHPDPNIAQDPDANMGANHPDPNIAEVQDTNQEADHYNPDISEVQDADPGDNHPDRKRVAQSIVNTSSRVTQRVANTSSSVIQTAVNFSNRLTKKVGQFSSSLIQPVFLLPLAWKVKKLGWGIDDLGKKLEYKFNDTDLPERASEDSERPRSYIPIKNSLIGREDDKVNIINKLLRPQRENETSVSVISIHGLKGVGKSALAKSVYDEKSVKSHFDLRIWIRVSEISSERDIIREIAESCTYRRSNYKRNPKSAKFLHSLDRQNEGTFRDLLGCQSNSASTSIPSNDDITNKEKKEIEACKRRLRKVIEGKLCLLVLDELDEACIKNGKHLKDLLAAGARGSRILVTTRIVEGPTLAKMGIDEPYELKCLSENDSWALFETFASGQDYRPRDSKLKKTGREIAVNCEGVPLTIKVAASFLYSKKEQTWSSFKEKLISHKPLERMDHVLRVSYSDLPTHLKACFSYCSLFPDNYNFYKNDLISLWIAQGFISPRLGQNLEEIAEMCFLELACRCFFEDVVIDDLTNIVTCKMHKIMCRLACRYSVGIMSSNITESGVNLDSTCKHVSFTSDSELMTISKTMLQAQHLRTLVSVKEPYSDTNIGLLVFNKLISGFQCLKVLSLRDLGIKELPNSIRNLIHLRYLDLAKNDGLLTLPKSITELYNLQTLKLNFCTKLTRLSGNFGELVNLKHLEIDECDSLTCMPQGLEKLNQLETLGRFVVCQDTSKDLTNIGLKALKDLNKLKGRLAIEFTGDWTSTIPEDPQAELSKKSHLVELKISWAKAVLNCETSNILSKEGNPSHKHLLDKLQPNLGLKILCIEGYKGGDLPVWAGVDMLAKFPHLVVISIEGGDKCKHLPPFGKLPSLKELTLRHMDNVKYVQKERFQMPSAGDSQDSTFFPCLEKLRLHNFCNLKGWWKDETLIIDEVKLPSFPCLLELRIWNCPKLQSMPLFTRVLDLDLRHVNQALLQESAKMISKDGSSSTTRNVNQQPLEEFANNISNNSSFNVRKFQIKGCSNLESFKTVKEGLGNLDSLQQLVVEKCNALSLLTSELSNLKLLKSLEISHCKELDLSDDGNSESSPWASLTSLRQLTLREIPKLRSLPEGLKYVRTLKSLCISACASLTALPQWIDNLTELQHLRIESCKAITRLPDEIENVVTLIKVEITECPELMKNCKEHTGEDWHKIKHARVLLHKSWRYGLVPEIGSSQNRSNVHALTDVNYIIIPVTATTESRIWQNQGSDISLHIAV